MNPILQNLLVFYCFSGFWQVFAVNNPITDWKTDYSKENSKRFQQLDQYAFSNDEPFHTDSLLVIQNKKIVYQKFANGYKVDQKHRIWSISKSISAMLIGIAIKEKLLSLDDLVSKYYPQVQANYAKQLKLRHLMHMSSGFNWSEGYESNPFNSDVIKMLYIDQHKDMAAYTASRPFLHPPGKVFHYSSGETNLIMGILKKTLTKAQYDDYPWRKLFDPLDIKTATWQQDLSGTFIGSSYLFMSPKDLAKIGTLILQKGLWNNKRVLSEDYVNYMTSLSPSMKALKSFEDDENDSYGAQWWLNQDLANKKDSKKYPSAPDDTILGLGHHGQLLVIIPSKNVVMVRYASDTEGAMDRDKILEYLMGAIHDKK
ncbi:MAG: serine hydrolase [Candidatus Cloacimonetes bacterium]|nr:serine hydrolase [Candidatus Cloacimonadota bacterium]